MNLNHLKYFSDAATLGSVSAAAQQNRVSQSAISQAIVALESDLGCELIFHKRNRFQLTEAGKLALGEGRQVFESLDRLKSRVSRQDVEIRGELKLGCINSLAGSLLSPILARLQKAHPRLELKLRLGNSEVIQKWVANQEVDLGLLVDEDLSRSLKAKKILTGEYRLVRAPQSRSSLEKTGVIVTRAQRAEARSLLSHFKKRNPAPLRIQMEVTSWEVIRRLVLSGMGVGLLPDYVIEEDLQKRRLLTVRAGDWRYRYWASAVTPKNREPSKAARLLLDQWA